VIKIKNLTPTFFMAHITSDVSRSLDEYLIISGRQTEGVTPDTVSLGGQLSEALYMPLSWFSAAMQCVTGPELGIALAQYGGCAVLPRSLPVETQQQMGREIKKAKAGFNYDVITVDPEMPIYELIELQRKTGYSSFPVVEKGKLVGLIKDKNYHPAKHAGLKVAARMTKRKDVITAPDGISLKEANEILLSRGIGILPVVNSEGEYVSSVFYSDIRKHVEFPDEFVDENGRYRFAGAVSTFEDDIERADALAEAGCDLLVVDTSDLKSDYGVKTIKHLKKRHPDIPLMAGNFVDREGFNLAADAGADIVKFGRGPGFACTTREVKKSGRGQATTIIEGAAARDEYSKIRRVPIAADGGMEHTGHMCVAYALGADFLMMGKYFGEFTESAAPLVRREVPVMAGRREIIVPVWFKEHWGEASRRAFNIARYGYKSSKWFVPEGGEGLIPHRGSIHDSEEGIMRDIAFVKRTFSESGATTPREFAERATLEFQSPGSIREGRSKV
jgi:IMP dehydrogenase